MKTKLILFTVIALLLGGVGCEKEVIRDNVPFKECDCEEKRTADLNFTNENAYLFKTTTENEKELLSQISNASNLIWIIYNTQTEKATIYISIGAVKQVCRICNFPDFAKKWSINDKGQKVYFEGTAYESCEQLGGIATVSYYDYVLTTLVKK